MPLDPQAKAVLEKLEGVPELNTLSPAEARQVFAAMTPRNATPEPVADVRDATADGIPVRIYTPQGQGPFPCLVYYHGGGWVVGDLNTYDGICRSLAHAAQ